MTPQWHTLLLRPLCAVLRGLQKLVVGDIAGVMIPRRDLNAKAEVIVKELNDVWTGIKLEHINFQGAPCIQLKPLVARPKLALFTVSTLPKLLAFLPLPTERCTLPIYGSSFCCG